MPTLSPSRALDFQRCPLLFRLRVIDKVPEPPSPAAARGTLVHAVLERLFDLPRPERTVSAALALVDPAYQAICAKDPHIPGLFATEEERRDWLASAEPLIRAYFTWEDPTRLEPEARELFIEADLGDDDGLKLRGFIDRLDVAPGTGALRVVDYKTGRAPAPRFAGEAEFQVSCYALALWKTRGVIPAMLQLVYLGNGGALLRFEPTQANLETTEARLHALLSAIVRTAESGVWPPAKGPLCGWCAHQALCPEFGGTPPELPPDTLARLGLKAPLP
ncbi:MAG: PD-(D/E)XK nuclease family protein [Micrococcales bacterium]|nr:PD-(D/E)XK nuclease family protein [Micrococcales bacterium]